MREVVINDCSGGFGLSHEAAMAYAERKGLTLYAERGKFGGYAYYKVPPEQYRALEEEVKATGDYKRLNENDWRFRERDIPRDDPDLVAVVRELRNQASGSYAKLRIIEIPEDVEWQIEEYDGAEHIAEAHRVWS